MNDKKINIIMLNMITYADFEKGIVNRNVFVMQNLLKDERVNKVLAVDFLHFRKKRLLKDYFQSCMRILHQRQSILWNIFSRCRRVSEKLFVYSTVRHIFDEKKMWNEISFLIRKLGMNETLVVFSYNPYIVSQYFALPDAFHVFDAVDNWMTHSSYTKQKRNLSENYQLIAKKAKIIFTVSHNLVSLFASLGRDEATYHIPNGVDTDFFEKNILQRQYQKVFQKIPHPRAGYLGTITPDRVDLDLLSCVINSSPGISFVLAGPIWKEFRAELEQKISGNQNVHLLGRIPYDQTAAVMSEFDVCLNPHKHSEFIRYTDPMKLYEYIAAGKPVVSTKNEGLEDIFSGMVSFANTPSEFCDKIQNALDTDTQSLMAQRKQWIQHHTYHARVQSMLQKIFSHFP